MDCSAWLVEIERDCCCKVRTNEVQGLNAGNIGVKMTREDVNGSAGNGVREKVLLEGDAAYNVGAWVRE